MSEHIDESPVFLTTRKYRMVVQHLRTKEAELAEFNDLRPFLGLAREIRDAVRQEEEKGVDEEW